MSAINPPGRQRVRVPDYLLLSAKDLSTGKTPHRRTSGATESSSQLRGEPDVLDTIASIMLWREISALGLPVTIEITANSGDKSDLRVQSKGSENGILINVKATKADIPKHYTSDTYGNVAVKIEELGAKNATWNINPVYLDFRDADTYARSDKEIKLPHIFIKVFVRGYNHNDVNPTGNKCNVTFSNWIATNSEEFSSFLRVFNKSISSGRVHKIPGINHPGLWIPPEYTKRYSELPSYLESKVL